MIRLALVLAAGLLCAAPVQAYRFRLIEPSVEVDVAKETIRVRPDVAWNRSPRPYHLPKTAEVWTMDGLALNELTFYGGIEDGKKIIRQSAVGPDKTLPVFKATMQPQDVVEFVENSLRVSFGTPVFEVTNLKPIPFAGGDGFQFDYAAVDTSDVRRKGRIAGRIHDGKLYLILFEAAALHYFDKDAAHVDALIASARLLDAPPAKRR